MAGRFPVAPMLPVEVQPSPHTGSFPEPPGPASVGERAAVPKFEYAARFPARLLAATLMTWGQSAGAVPETATSSLPAAVTTVTPRAHASVAACRRAAAQGPAAPSESEITWAGWSLCGTEGTSPPDAHSMAAIRSDSAPP